MVVRHYGPIRLNPAVAPTWADAIVVEAKDSGSCSWFDVGTLFQIMSPTDLADPRAIGLAKPINAQPKGGLFRIRLIPGAIHSDGTAAASPVIWPTACDNEPSFEFQILPDCDLDGTPDSSDPDFYLCAVNPCRANYSGDDAISVQDIFDFLGAYFAPLPCADFNNSGGVSVQDIFDFLAAWFAANTGTVCDPALSPDC